MPKARNKIIRGAREALAYARGNCPHEWVYKRNKAKTTLIRHCRKCGVRETTWRQPSH